MPGRSQPKHVWNPVPSRSVNPILFCRYVYTGTPPLHASAHARAEQIRQHIGEGVHITAVVLAQVVSATPNPFGELLPVLVALYNAKHVELNAAPADARVEPRAPSRDACNSKLAKAVGDRPPRQRNEPTPRTSARASAGSSRLPACQGAQTQTQAPPVMGHHTHKARSPAPSPNRKRKGKAQADASGGAMGGKLRLPSDAVRTNKNGV